MRICEGLSEVPECFAIEEDVNSVTIPATVTRIGRFAFQGSRGLREVIFEGESLIRIGACAFMGCTNLSEIEFPGSLVSIEQGAFRDCTSLVTVRFRAGTSKINNLGSWSFANTRLTTGEVQEVIDDENRRRHPGDLAVATQDLSLAVRRSCHMLTRDDHNGQTLRVEEGCSVPRICDIAELFGFDYRQVVRGFTAIGGVPHPVVPHTGIWWPKISSVPNPAGWLNVVTYDESGDIIKIVERNVANKEANEGIMYYHQHEIRRQIVMANIDGQRCDTGYCYRFIGVFELNVHETQQQHACVWYRVSTEWPV